MLPTDIAKVDTEVQTSLEFLNPVNRQAAAEELRRLREDKSLLEGKVRGYLTLSDICHEYKEELKKLQLEYNRLKEKVNSSSLLEDMEMKPHSSESPAPHDDPRQPQPTDQDQRSEPDDKRRTATSLNVTAEISQLKEQLNPPVVTSELFDPGVASHTTCSNQQTGAMKAGVDVASRDKFPMQESMIGDFEQPSVPGIQSLTGMGFEVPSDDLVLGQSAGVSQQKCDRDLMKFHSFLVASSTSPAEPTHESLNEKLKSLSVDDREAMEVKSYIDKIINTNNQLQNINRVLLDENTSLKTKVKALDTDNRLLLEKVSKLEREKYELSMSRSKSPESSATGWVQVEKAQLNQAADNDELEGLRDRCKQLMEANQRWSAEWENLRKHYDTRIADFQTERDRLAKEITDMKIADESKHRDYEKMIMASKKRVSDEENAKEEANLQVVAANNKMESLQAKIDELNGIVTQVRRENQTVKMELSIARQQQQVGQVGVQQHHGVTQQQVNEIEALRQQLLVFQEDFDKERQDRAVAQSIKDDLKKQNDTLKKRVRHLEHKHATTERQAKVLEESSRKALEEKERLIQELANIRGQLQHERERPAMMNQYRPQQPPIIQSAGLRNPTHSQSTYRPQPQQHIVPPQSQYTGARGYGGQYMAGGPGGGAASSAYPPRNPVGTRAEQLPGAWSCNQCTYVNYPGRTVCEMCGYINSPTQGTFNYKNSAHYNGENLQPRGDEIMMPPQQQQHQQQQQFHHYGVRAPSQNELTDTRNLAI